MEDFKGTKRQLFALQDATGWSVFTERNLICRTHNKPSLEEAKANAQLIAAAPELLHRLNSLMLSIKAHPDYQTGRNQEFTDLVSLAEETINKALGKEATDE